MNKKNQVEESILPWKKYTIAVAEAVLAFYIATFSIVFFFLHRGPNWALAGIMMAACYALVIFICAKRIVQTFSISALMLITPIAPLLALIIVVTMIPILDKLH